MTSPPCISKHWMQEEDKDYSKDRLKEVELFQIYIPHPFDLIDDTNIRICRPGSGPVGDYVGVSSRDGNLQLQRSSF
eukprot:6246599-Ditylum_brightwellii.AAC.1